MRFLHCSDVHVTLDYSKIPWSRLGWRRCIARAELTFGGRQAAYARAPETLRTIADHARTRADHLLVTGDLTAYALDGEFAGARAALGSLADSTERCTVIPGNHDVYTPGSVRTRRFEKHFGHLLESAMPEYRREDAFPFVHLVGEDVAVVGLRSGRVPFAPGFSYGVIGAAQLEGLAAMLADPRLDGRAVLVMVHHAPLTEAGVPDRPMHGLKDAQALLSLLPGPRFAVLHGHIHHRYHHPATAHRPHIFGAGSSTQSGREGYWLIDVEGGVVKGGEKVSLPPAD